MWVENIEFTFLLLTLIAEVVGTIGGFGSSVFFVPAANIYFDFHHVLGLTAVFHLSSNLSKIALFREGINRQLILWLGIPAVLFVIVGGILSNLFNTQWLEILLGAFLILLSVTLLIFPKLQLKRGKREALLGGIGSGFSAGLLGTGGAIRGLTMAAFNLEKSVFITTSAIIDFAIDFARTIVYFYDGYIVKELLIYIPFLLVIGFLGTYLGRWLLNYISQDSFKNISLSLILCIGILTIISIFG